MDKTAKRAFGLMILFMFFVMIYSFLQSAPFQGECEWKVPSLCWPQHISAKVR